MIVLYKKENNQFTASFEDSQGFKTHFGPYPTKTKMVISISDYFRNTNKGHFEIRLQSLIELMKPLVYKTIELQLRMQFAINKHLQK